jgi:hypothetical protein
MKELGCPIKYSRKRNSYYYDGEGEVLISFFDKHSEDGHDSGGGKNYFMIFFSKTLAAKIPQ